MSRLTIATSAKADGTGGVTFGDFGSPGPTTAWIVTAAVPLAPGTASFQAWRTTEVWATWLGSAAGGPLLVTGSQRLVVKGTSLVDTVTYRCVLTGSQVPEATAEGVQVAPISSSTLTQTTISGDITATLTGPVTLAATSEVVVKSGTIDVGTIPAIDLAAGATVDISGTVDITGPVTIDAATASGQTAPTFAGRTVSAQSTAYVLATGATWYTLIPAPGAGKYLELHGFGETGDVTSTVTLSITPSTTGKFATFKGVVAFDFQGATLAANTGVYAKGAIANVQLNYTVRT